MDGKRNIVRWLAACGLLMSMATLARAQQYGATTAASVPGPAQPFYGSAAPAAVPSPAPPAALSPAPASQFGSYLQQAPPVTQSREIVDPNVRPVSVPPENIVTENTSFQQAAGEPPSLGDRLKSLEDAFRANQNKLPLVRLSGFFHYDTGFFSQTPNSLATLGDIQNGSDFRRARLQALGNVTEFTRYSIEMDFGNGGAGRPSFMDVWGEQTNLPFLGNLRIGQFRQPITMTSWTNIRHLEFMERATPFQAFDPFRRVGAMAYRVSEDEMTMLAYSVYGTGFTFFNGTNTSYNTLGGDNRFGTQIGDNGGISFASRLTHLLYYDEPAEGRYLLHVGGGYNFSEIGGGGTGSFARTYQARAIPEFFVGDSAAGGLTAGGTPFVVDTGRFLATSYNLYHLELAGNYGSAHFQAEYIVSAVNQLNGPMVFYDGAYFQTGYFLTGESAGYNKQAGVLDYNCKPFADFFGLKTGMCGWGAWEVAFRWSWLDLSARNINPANQAGFATVGPPASPNPGVVNQGTLALNWWWNQYTRVQFNYIHSMLDSNNFGFSAMDIFATRFATEF